MRRTRSHSASAFQNSIHWKGIGKKLDFGKKNFFGQLFRFFSIKRSRIPPKGYDRLRHYSYSESVRKRASQHFSRDIGARHAAVSIAWTVFQSSVDSLARFFQCSKSEIGLQKLSGEKIRTETPVKELKLLIFQPFQLTEEFFSRGEGVQIVFTTACPTKVILANKQTILELKTKPSQDSITLKKTRSRVFMNKI